MLGDVASGLKIPFSDIAYLYGTLKTQGRAYTRDIMQFTQRGIPVIKELAKQFKVTEEEVSKMVESGKVGFSDIEKAFQSMTKSGGMFYNMMQEQSKTTGGQISMLGDSWDQLKVNIGKSQTGIIQGTVSFLNELTSGLAQGFAYENYVSEAFAKENIKQFGFFDNFGLGGNTKKMMSEALAAQAMQRESLAAKGKGQSVLAKTQAENEYLSLKRSYKLGKIEKEEYDIRSAILLKNIQNLQGIYRTYGMKGTAPAPAGAPTPTGAATAEAAARASAPKYTQIHINIAEMKAAENIEISDVKDPNYRVVEDKVMEMILGALNDAQRMSVH